MKSVSIRIHGRVQGVGFRHHTQQIAHNNNICGIVKNMIDGSVYIEASGKEPDLDKFAELCQNGPRWAYVESVEVLEITDKGYSGFKISN